LLGRTGAVRYQQKSRNGENSRRVPE